MLDSCYEKNGTSSERMKRGSGLWERFYGNVQSLSGRQDEESWMEGLALGREEWRLTVLG